ncbi:MULTISPECIES: J domain-containing protein [unclassified Pyramidobacter]|uniref:J domain-containing protein n=1 Tax=unclassified Pyramidobacter TaxID=2632171 RepID=UPI000EA1C68E|nr:J domain-containing protein [Pyramidobacter sp. CG50-2]RKJ78719.1 hypothetical protein D7D26_06315 [Pyramidobacter sp. CG50-2]
MRLGLLGGIVGVLFVLWLIPTLVNGFFGLVWFLVKLPFRLLYLIVVDGLFGLLGLAWKLCSGFFALFGVVGTAVMWLLIAAAGVWGGVSLLSVCAGTSPSRRSGRASSAPRAPAEKVSAGAPRFASRRWALGIFGLGSDASQNDIKRRYRELVAAEHADRTASDRAGERRLAQIDQAYEILTH